MKSKNKKSQITIFIIIGIVIVVIVAFIYGASRYASKAETETAVKKTREAALNVQPIVTYIESCVDRYAKQALVIVGRQGGRLLASQGGTLYSFRSIENASYAIYPPNPLAMPDDYPWEIFPYSGGIEVFKGIFGDNRLPPLTKGDGANSIQLQLESFVLSKIDSCDLAVFENQFDIVKGTPSVETTIAKGNIVFKLIYPLAISDIATGAKTDINEFQASVRIRLGKVYELARVLVINDIGDITFNLATASLYDMDVMVEPKDEGNDLITISDPMSILAGNPFEFRFARRNRKPALRWINEELELPAFNLNDKMVIENLTTQDPKAYDPDEDFPTLTPEVFFKVGDDYLSEIGPLTCASFPVTICAWDGYLDDCQEVNIRIEPPCP